MSGNRITLRTYSNIWKIERRLEHLNGIRISSVPLEHAAYVLAFAVLEGLLLFLAPPLRRINWLVLAAFPLGAGSFLKKVKVDGKNPAKYFLNLMEFALAAKTYSRFREVGADREIYFDELIAYRRDRILKGSENVGE